MSFHASTIELKDDTVIVVLGASGDLAKKKTVRVSLEFTPR
jgi:glucose-6-phosphate 1-dehydrogenase